MIGRDVQTAIDEMIRDRLGNENVVLVKANRGETSDQGDELLDVTVIITKSTRDFDQRKISGLSRGLRSVLRPLGEMGFPIVSFISRDDIKACA